MDNLQKNGRRAAGLLGLVALLMLSGCATIVGDLTQRIPIKSNPAGAHIEIYDEAGRDVFQGSTPAEVVLPKSTGKYWGGKRFHVSISKDGYYGRGMTIVARPNGWYLAGNFVFGGAIGWFLIDPWNGKMYGLSPDGIEADLKPIISGARLVQPRPTPPTPPAPASTRPTEPPPATAPVPPINGAPASPAPEAAAPPAATGSTPVAAPASPPATAPTEPLPTPAPTGAATANPTAPAAPSEATSTRSVPVTAPEPVVPMLLAPPPSLPPPPLTVPR